MKSVVMTAVAPILWGTTYIVTTELLPGYSVLVVGTVRALPVGVAFLILGRTCLAACGCFGALFWER